MMKRALTLFVVALLFPSLALAAPVKRFKMRGIAKEMTYNLKGVKTTDAWATAVSITQTSSTVTINFLQVDGKAAQWVLKKSESGWMRNIPAFEVPPPRNSDFDYCELSGTVGLKLSGKTGSFASFFQMDCDNDTGTTTAVTSLALKLRR
jgi:hypothetical protein